MAFGTQVAALLRKDWRVFKANRKASCMEVLFPIVMGILTGVFIVLIQVVQNSFGEYENIDTTEPIYAPDIGADTWLAFIAKSASPYAMALASFLHPMANLTTVSFNNFTSAFDAYKNTSGKSVYFALEAEDQTNFTLYSATGGDSRWSAAYSLGDLLTSSAASNYSQTVHRHADHESFASIPNLRAIFSSTGCMFLIYAFIPSLILTGGRLVEEKRVKVRESLKVMGLSDSAYLLSNFISSFLRMAVGTGLISVCLAAFSVIEASHIPEVFLIGLLFAVSLIAFAQIMPALFSVSIWSNVMCIILLSGGAALSSLSTGWGKGTEVLVCLLSPSAFYYGILPYMAKGTIILQLSTQEATFMLAIDIILYLIIGNYIYAVAPGEFGVPKHPLFFIRWIWHRAGAEHSQHSDGVPDLDPSERSASRVIVRGLLKYFGDQRETASVDKLSLNVKRGEIFALLGHNGAGKTTTISILTGMITPTTYTEASVDGLDINENMDAIRRTVGLCPQFDVLFNDLTARQHLELFSEIKGVVDQERISYLMQELELPDTEQKSITFSGGTKRRLSVGNALVGGSTLIYLDEPSSGMDPLSRRKMWDLLKEEKNQGKTIVLTTHFMEEADYLGERIAIMSRGRMYCCDTAQQLKEQFGVGYYLNLVKGEKSEGGSARSSNVEEAAALVKKFVPEAELHHESSGEAQILLPISALPIFGDMLTALEAKLHSLGFHSYGLSMNTLEDVFVNISEREEAEHERKQSGTAAHAPRHTTATERGAPNGGASVDPDLTQIGSRTPEEIFLAAMRVPASTRFFHQVGTVFWRKVTMLRRTRRMQLMIILFPIFFILIAFLVIQPQAVSSSASEGHGLPDFMNLMMLNFQLRDAEDNLKVISEFTTLYTQDAFKGAQLNVYTITDMNDYGSGSYIPMHSLSFASGFNSPDVVFGFLPHQMQLSSGDAPFCNYTFVFNKKYDPSVGTQLLTMINTAIERAAGNAAAPLLTFNLQQFPASAETTPAPTAPSQTVGGDDTTYNFMQVGIYTVIAVVQLVANCAIPVADEMQRQVYHANRVQGMSAAAYFIGNLLFDFACCLFPIALMVLMIFAKNIGAFYGFVTFWVVVAGLLFCVHVVLQAYVLVTHFPSLKPVTYTGILHGANLLMMGWPYLTEVVLNSIGMPDFAQLKPFILALTPPAAFYHILDNASDLTRDTTHAGYIMTLTGTVATAWGFVFMVVELALPVGMLYLFATGYSAKRLHRRRTAPGSSLGDATPYVRPAVSVNMDEKAPLLSSPTGAAGADADVADRDEDPDVSAERQRVTGNPEENMMSAVDLVKRFNDKVAVRNVSFGIRRGECFGLLGPNGAGKSTTCNVILRHLVASSGDVMFPYANVNSDDADEDAFAKARIGVCMQGDSLWEFLSAAEHMDQYLRLRLTTEYKPEEWQRYIQKTIEKVYLADAGERYAGRYSGGMKRKLLVCLAMYTGAISVFLDEPSTGMDPFSRRALWSVILEALSHDRCVLLTTHSMEEADAVCSRISIITSGQLRCIGSSQHLKNRFGAGYVLTLVHHPMCSEEATFLIDKGVQKLFPAAEVQEVLGHQRRYGLGKIESLATAFRLVQGAKDQLRLQQYSISQTVSLEHIFLAFVGTTSAEDGSDHKH